MLENANVEESKYRINTKSVNKNQDESDERAMGRKGERAIERKAIKSLVHWLLGHWKQNGIVSCNPVGMTSIVAPGKEERRNPGLRNTSDKKAQLQR